jgi:hypothetical protein
MNECIYVSYYYCTACLPQKENVFYILYFIFSQCRTRKEPVAKHQKINDEKAIGFVLTPTSKMELDTCLLEHLGHIFGRKWHIPSYW